MYICRDCNYERYIKYMLDWLIEIYHLVFDIVIRRLFKFLVVPIQFFVKYELIIKYQKTGLEIDFWSSIECHIPLEIIVNEAEIHGLLRCMQGRNYVQKNDQKLGNPTIHL